MAKHSNVRPDNEAGGDGAPAFREAQKQGEESAGQMLARSVRQEVAQTRLPWYRTRRLGYLLLGVYALLLLLFGLLAWWVHSHPVLALDVAITREFQEEQNPWLRALMLAVSFLGSAPLVFSLLIALVALLLWTAHLRLETLILIGDCLTSELLNHIIKLIVARPRPTSSLVEVLQTASGASFPSGHVMAYLAFWGLLFSYALILFGQHRWWRTLLLAISAFFIVMVGPSRIYLGDHWASDVLGAYLLGGLWLSLWLLLYLKLRARGLLAARPTSERP
jgi:membrane-associated phospholipid phosphatase